MKGTAKANLKMHLHQAQVMTPQLLQSIRLLQLTALELDMEVRQAMDSNLMLESGDEEGDEESAAPTMEASPEPVAESAAPTDSVDAEVSGCDAAATERVEADFDWSSSESWSGGEPCDEDGESYTSRIPDVPPQDPRLQALAQLQLVVTDPREAELIAAIIDAIDDNGYLGESLEAIAAKLPAEWAVRMEELEAALQRVQSVEPTGFGARNLSECLRLQLDALPEGVPGIELAHRIVTHHLEALAGVDDVRLAQQLGFTAAEVREARMLICSLDPKPGAAGNVPAQAVTPDVTISGQPGAWKVELNPETLPRVRINRRYEQHISGAAAYKALRDQLNEARWLVRGLEMRHETLLKTARVVFERQRQFLRIGEEGMVPLTLREVAEAIGMHESTVCRVVANKHALTPWGVYPLKAFFPTQITGAEGDTSGTAVRAMIRKIIDGENSAHPLCDGEVAALLARRGVRVARRTVAKYREAMRIAPASLRAQTVRAAEPITL
jgi:RNA polymerase sigma-54 factor